MPINCGFRIYYAGEEPNANLSTRAIFHGGLEQVSKILSEQWVFGAMTRDIEQGPDGLKVESFYYFDSKGSFAVVGERSYTGSKSPFPYVIMFASSTQEKLEQTVKELSLPFDRTSVWNTW